MNGEVDSERLEKAKDPGLPRNLILLSAVVFLEAAAMSILAGFLFFELFADRPASLGGAVTIFVIAAISAVWLFVLAVNCLRARRWVRGAALTWQVLQLAVAFGSFQGLFARDDIGWLLLLPAVLAIFLLFTKSVVKATARQD